MDVMMTPRQKDSVTLTIYGGGSTGTRTCTLSLIEKGSVAYLVVNDLMQPVDGAMRITAGGENSAGYSIYGDSTN